MKSLAIALAVVAFAPFAHAGGPGEVPAKKQAPAELRGEEQEEHRGFRAGLRRMRDDVRDTTYDATYRLTHTDHSEPGEDHHVRDSIRNFFHNIKLHRPRAFHYLEMRKSKEGVNIFVCEPMIERLANAQQCHKMHDKAFNPKALLACSEKNEDSKFARRIGRNLDKLMRRDFDIRRVDDSIPDVEGYAEFLEHCEGKRAVAPARPAARPAVKPVERPAPAGEANPEFKPVDLPKGQAPGEAGDTL